MEDKKKGDNECIKVMVRCRPLSKKEKDEKSLNIVDIDASIRQITVKHTGNTQEVPKSFTFDGVFDEHTQQKYFYEEACFPLIESVLEGFNATIFAYGQTGSGKSWTMQGDPENPELRGVMPNAFSHIFEFIKGTKDVQFLLRCSYLEIYNEEIRDLLSNHHDKANPIKYDIRDDPVKGAYVSNLTHVVVETEKQMMLQLEKGLAIRTVAQTLMNDTSSRSHSIFTIIIEMSTKDENGKEHVKAGKLNLVDLAGSERQKKTGAVGKVLKEGAKINLSLLTLGLVISALADGKSKHIQYRDSKLTRLLQDSLGGNTKTCMVAAISPAESNFDETVSTLRYANNAKNIKNKPRINEDPKDTMIREFKEEINRLKELLMQQAAAPGRLSEMMALAPMQRQDSLIVRAGAEKPIDSEEIEKTPSSDSPPGELVESLNAERAQVLEQLKAKESEVEQERRLREELSQRLAELQHMFVGKPTDETEEEKKADLSQEELEEQARIEAERVEAERIHKERKQRARKRREQLEKEELTYVLEEKKAVEDELDELRQSIAATEKNNYVEVIEKKVSKVRRKYEKKLQDAQIELEGLKDDFEYQREQLVDALHDEEKNSKLFESICRALLSEKDIAKIIDRCRIDDDGELIIPHIKQKTVEISRPASSAGRGSKTTTSKLPDLIAAGNSTPEQSKSTTLSLTSLTIQYQDTSLPPMSGVKSSRSPAKQGIASRTTENAVSALEDNSPTHEAPKKKKKNKKPKQNEVQSEEAIDGDPAGPLSDWGFSDAAASKNSQASAGGTDREYSDEEFEVDESESANQVTSPDHSKATAVKKKYKSKNASNNEGDGDNSTLVPIGKKTNNQASSTTNKNMMQSTSLPQI